MGYIDCGNEFCPPPSGAWRAGTSFLMPDMMWPRDPNKILKARISSNGIIIYTFGKKNYPVLTPVFEPVPENYLDQIKFLVKLMAIAGGLTAAERIAREKLKNFPPDFLRNIILGAAAGAVIGLATSFTGVGTAAGVTAIIASAILVNISIEQLNNSSNADS